MLKEALEFMHGLGKSAADVVVKPACEPAHVYYLRKPDGTLDKATADPAPAAHAAYNLSAIGELAAEVHEAGVHAEVWIDPAAVVLVFGDDARDRATLALAESDPLRVLRTLKQTGQAITQAALVQYLRTTFRDSLAMAPNLAESVKRVKFVSGQTTDSEIAHGKASVGKSLMGEVTGTGVIPEYVKFSVPLYTNPGLQALRATVECALEPNAQTGQFHLIPLPGQLEAATEAGIQGVRTLLRGGLPDAVKVYFGKP